MAKFNPKIKSIATKQFYALCFMLFAFSGFGQITVFNKCAIDYNQFQTNQNGNGQQQQMADPTQYYFTSTTFLDQTPNSSNWVWNFGDGSPVQTGKIVQHRFASDALYTVTLTSTVNGLSVTKTELVKIEYAPKAPILAATFDKRDSTNCEAFTLDPYKNQLPPSNVIYEWFPSGKTTNTILADSSGLYSVKVTDQTTGCYVTASLVVQICGEQSQRQSTAEYHFGNGIKRVASHGATSNANPFPVTTSYTPGGSVHSSATSTSIQNPNIGRYLSYLFSTDGNSIFNKDGSVMKDANGTDINLLPAGVQSTNSYIIPIIKGDSTASTQYYALGLGTNGNLYFTLVETAGSTDGNGVVILPSTLLAQNLSTRMAVGPYNRYLAQYIFVTQDQSGNYNSYTINPLGIEGPIVSPSNHPSTSNTGGQMKISNNGQKLLSTYIGPPENFVEVCNIDSTSGAIRACIKYSIDFAANAQLYGAEFSQDGRYVYYTVNYTSPADGVTSRLYRLDTQTNERILVDYLNGQNFGALQAANAPGQTIEILVAVQGSNAVGVIANTMVAIDSLHKTNDNDTTITFRKDRLGYKRDNYSTQNTTVNLNLFNVVTLPEKSSSSSDSFEAEIGCEDDQIGFQASAACDLKPEEIKYEWDFGDGSATGIGQKVQHVYANPGRYQVRLFLTYCPSKNAPIILYDTIRVLPKAVVDLKPEFVHCFSTIPTLAVLGRVTNIPQLNTEYSNILDYVWNPEALPLGNIPTGFTATKEGKYDLTVNNTYDVDGEDITCTSVFTTEIIEYCPPIFVVPTAFTPNGDNTNSKLNIIQQDLYSEDFEFRIYNRWGELVYYSEDLAETAWDGNFKEKQCQPDTYVWTVKYRSRFDPTGILYKYQGALALFK